MRGFTGTGFAAAVVVAGLAGWLASVHPAAAGETTAPEAVSEGSALDAVRSRFQENYGDETAVLFAKWLEVMGVGPVGHATRVVESADGSEKVITETFDGIGAVKITYVKDGERRRGTMELSSGTAIRTNGVADAGGTADARDDRYRLLSEPGSVLR